MWLTGSVLEFGCRMGMVGVGLELRCGCLGGCGWSVVIGWVWLERDCG